MIKKAIFLLSLFVLIGSCGKFSIERDVPRAIRIEVPDGVSIDPSVAVPSGISRDGEVVVGTIFTLVGGTLFSPAQGFKWTESGGTELIDDVPGYEGFVTIATAVNGDATVIVGSVISYVDPDLFIPWVWQNGTYSIIDFPEGAYNKMLHGVSLDGTMVLGAYEKETLYGGTTLKSWTIFVWTREKGIVPLAKGPQLLPVGISDDGLTVAYNCYNPPDEIADDYDGHCTLEGTWRLQSSSRDWILNDKINYIDFPPPIDLSNKNFWASDFNTTAFENYSAHSSNLSVIGGFSLEDVEILGVVKAIAHPALWLVKEGNIIRPSGLGWPGDVTAISPDGKFAGFSNHAELGSEMAYIWSAEHGMQQLYQLIRRSDEFKGTNMLGVITGNPTFLTDFSGDNNVAAGFLHSYSAGADIFGFVIRDFLEILE